MNSGAAIFRVQWVFRSLLTGVLCSLIISCQSSKPEYEASSVTINEKSFRKVSSAPEGCLDILNSYCGTLYSPDSSGNLIINRTLTPIHILQGETYNQISQIYVKYAIAKRKNKQHFPVEFRQALAQYNYFAKLDEFLNRKPVTVMSLDERKTTEFQETELSAIWQSSMEQAVMTRMSAKYPTFHRISTKLMPIEYEIEARRVRRQLISDVSKAVWHNDANWKKVIVGFNDLKLSFLTLFDQLDIPDKVRSAWKEKISSVEIVLPGSMPEISDEECSTTNVNAYYYSHMNLITVCAGDFNSEDIILTLAHEMSHSLDVERGLYLSFRNSELGKKMSQFRGQVCSSPAAYSCEDWSKFKDQFSLGALKLDRFEPDLPDFQRCLKKNKTTKFLDDSQASRIANRMSRDRISNMASSDLFLRLIKDKIPLKNGKLQKNPNFMNPCGYYLWSKDQESIDDDLYTLLFFTYEYKCSAQEDEGRLKDSIETARTLTANLLSQVLLAQGEFANTPELVVEGFASPPHERFADVVGTYAVAEYLRKMSNIWDRRSAYLASSSWLCQEPSLESVYPKESKIEKLFSMSVHAEGEERKKEVLSGPIRSVLRCQKDFEFDDCTLPFKAGRK
jgi:hypothetical protein